MENQVLTQLISLIEMIDESNVLSAKRKQWLANRLMEFCIYAVTKYVRGQEEHKGEIEDIDLRREVLMENIDMFWYIMALSKPLKKQ